MTRRSTQIRLALLFPLTGVAVFLVFTRLVYATEPGPLDDSLVKVIGDGIHVAKQWKTVGGLGSMVGLSLLLMRLLTIPPIGPWLDRRGWLPMVAGALGAVAGALGALASHGSIGTGLTEGYMAGLAAVGFHQQGRQWMKARAANGAPEPE